MQGKVTVKRGELLERIQRPTTAIEVKCLSLKRLKECTMKMYNDLPFHSFMTCLVYDRRCPLL